MLRPRTRFDIHRLASNQYFEWCNSCPDGLCRPGKVKSIKARWHGMAPRRPRWDCHWPDGVYKARIAALASKAPLVVLHINHCHGWQVSVGNPASAARVDVICGPLAHGCVMALRVMSDLLEENR